MNRTFENFDFKSDYKKLELFIFMNDISPEVKYNILFQNNVLYILIYDVKKYINELDKLLKVIMLLFKEQKKFIHFFIENNYF